MAEANQNPRQPISREPETKSSNQQSHRPLQAFLLEFCERQGNFYEVGMSRTALQRLGHEGDNHMFDFGYSVYLEPLRDLPRSVD